MRARAAIAIAAFCMGCGGAPPTPAPPPLPPLHLAPLADLAPAAGLSWIVIARPRELAAGADLIPALHAVMPEERLTAFAARNGGVSPLELEELVAAAYRATTLYLARGMIDPSRVEGAFAAHEDPGEDRGRAIDRGGGAAPGQAIVRLWGSVRGARQQIAMFGREGVGLEIGRFGPLRAAELFAEERLKRASPALRSDPLARAAELVGDAPVRAFAIGPFEGETAHLLAGLMAASTSAGIGMRVVKSPSVKSSDLAAIEVTLVLTGAWNDQAAAAAERLRAAFHTFGETAIGRLAGLDHPLADPIVAGAPDALRLTATFDALALARGIRAATDAEVSEIMAY